MTGTETGGGNHFVKEQGEEVCRLLKGAFNKNPEPSVYIISPFTTVVHGISELIRKEFQGTDIAQYMLDSGQKRIGTVHTFQGKEADEVIFLLGCDTSGPAAGAIRWVNRNIVNVAATRAKCRLYIIGDAEAWKASDCVTKARSILLAHTQPAGTATSACAVPSSDGQNSAA